MEEKYYIYKITNLVNGKVYVGETCTGVSDRFKRHLEKASNCVKLKRAFNKYRKENFFAAAELHWIRLDERRIRRKNNVDLFRNITYC